MKMNIRMSNPNSQEISCTLPELRVVAENVKICNLPKIYNLIEEFAIKPINMFLYK